MIILYFSHSHPRLLTLHLGLNFEHFHRLKRFYTYFTHSTPPQIRKQLFHWFQRYRRYRMIYISTPFYVFSFLGS